MDLPTPEAMERVLLDGIDLEPDAEVIDRPDWVQVRTPSSVHSNHNKIVVARLGSDDADAAIDHVVAEHGSRGAAFQWIVGPSSTPSDLAERLTARGLERLGPAHGMTHLRFLSGYGYLQGCAVLPAPRPRLPFSVERVEVGVELAPDTFTLQPSIASGQAKQRHDTRFPFGACPGSRNSLINSPSPQTVIPAKRLLAGSSLDVRHDEQPPSRASGGFSRSSSRRNPQCRSW